MRKGLESCACKNWTPDDLHQLLTALASDHQKPGESDAQAYTRVAMQHPAGKLLYKAYREASMPGWLSAETFGGETREDRIAKQADLDGENHARLHSMAVDMQRARPGLSYERAFATVYGDPKNKKLADGAKQEHLSRAIRSAWGGDSTMQGDTA